MEGCMATSLSDNCGWLVRTDSVVQLCERLERVRVKAVELGDQNHVAFNNAMDEMIAFIRRTKLQLKRRISEARITVCGHNMRFNTEANR